MSKNGNRSGYRRNDRKDGAITPRLLDLAFDTDLPAYPYWTLVAACRRANQSGEVFMSAGRWAREAKMKVSTFRSHRDFLIKSGFLIPAAVRAGGIRAFRIGVGTLLAHQIGESPYARSAPSSWSGSGRENLKHESKGDSATVRSEKFLSMKAALESQDSEKARLILQEKFPAAKAEFEAIMHFDDPILRITTMSVLHNNWLVENESSILAVLRAGGLSLTNVVVELLTRGRSARSSSEARKADANG